MVAHYMIVERQENWLVDKSNGFQSFGLSDRFRAVAAGVREGDILFTYISGGISALADARECTRDGYQPLRHGGDYDMGFPIQILTKPLLVLESPRWVQIHRLIDRLNFLRGKKDWRQAFRQTIRALGQEDAEVIYTALKASQAAY
jgi:hypothetical protein